MQATLYSFECAHVAQNNISLPCLGSNKRSLSCGISACNRNPLLTDNSNKPLALLSHRRAATCGSVIVSASPIKVGPVVTGNVSGDVSVSLAQIILEDCVSGSFADANEEMLSLESPPDFVLAPVIEPVQDELFELSDISIVLCDAPVDRVEKYSTCGTVDTCPSTEDEVSCIEVVEVETAESAEEVAFLTFLQGGWEQDCAKFETGYDPVWNGWYDINGSFSNPPVWPVVDSTISESSNDGLVCDRSFDTIRSREPYEFEGFPPEDPLMQTFIVREGPMTERSAIQRGYKPAVPKRREQPRVHNKAGYQRIVRGQFVAPAPDASAAPHVSISPCPVERDFRAPSAERQTQVQRPREPPVAQHSRVESDRVAPPVKGQYPIQVRRGPVDVGPTYAVPFDYNPYAHSYGRRPKKMSFFRRLFCCGKLPY